MDDCDVDPRKGCLRARSPRVIASSYGHARSADVFVVLSSAPFVPVVTVFASTSPSASECGRAGSARAPPADRLVRSTHRMVPTVAYGPRGWPVRDGRCADTRMRRRAVGMIVPFTEPAPSVARTPIPHTTMSGQQLPSQARPPPPSLRVSLSSRLTAAHETMTTGTHVKWDMLPLGHSRYAVGAEHARKWAGPRRWAEADMLSSSPPRLLEVPNASASPWASIGRCPQRAQIKSTRGTLFRWTWCRRARARHDNAVDLAIPPSCAWRPDADLARPPPCSSRVLPGLQVSGWSRVSQRASHLHWHSDGAS